MTSGFLSVTRKKFKDIRVLVSLVRSASQPPLVTPTLLARDKFDCCLRKNRRRSHVLEETIQAAVSQSDPKSTVSWSIITLCCFHFHHKRKRQVRVPNGLLFSPTCCSTVLPHCALCMNEAVGGGRSTREWGSEIAPPSCPNRTKLSTEAQRLRHV